MVFICCLTCTGFDGNYVIFSRQKLLLKNADIPVIMNTYFSQKVLLSEHLETSKTQGPTKMLIRKNIISLAQTFKLDDLDNKQPQESPDNQVRLIHLALTLAFCKKLVSRCLEIITKTKITELLSFSFHLTKAE